MAKDSIAIVDGDGPCLSRDWNSMGSVVGPREKATHTPERNAGTKGKGIEIPCRPSDSASPLEKFDGDPAAEESSHDGFAAQEIKRVVPTFR